MVLSPILKEYGIVYRRSCPHTHPQMSLVERRHRHVVDGGLALLNQAELSHEFWSMAFATIVFLHNRTTSITLEGKSSYELLFKKTSNLKDLKVFGCHAHPNLRPFIRHNFSTRSEAHIFIGYPHAMSGYMCYNPRTRKVLVTRDVIFLENDFTNNKPIFLNVPRAESERPKESISSVNNPVAIIDRAMQKTC